jgi:excisionase family DNA binding protein
MKRKPFSSYPDLLTAREVAEMLRVGMNTVYDLLNCGQIPAVRVGHSYRITKASVLEYLGQK